MRYLAGEVFISLNFKESKVFAEETLVWGEISFLILLSSVLINQRSQPTPCWGGGISFPKSKNQRSD